MVFSCYDLTVDGSASTSKIGIKVIPDVFNCFPYPFFSMTQAIVFLNELDNDDLDWLVLKGKRRYVDSGTVLIREGQNINALYIILRGVFSVSVEKGNNPHEIAHVSSGELLGEISFIDPRPPLATVTALENSEVLEVSRLELNFKLFRNMGFASRFYRGLSICLADRMHNLVRQISYEPSNEDTFVDPSLVGEQVMVKDLALAYAKFNWLVQRAK